MLCSLQKFTYWADNEKLSIFNLTVNSNSLFFCQSNRNMFFFTMADAYGKIKILRN